MATLNRSRRWGACIVCLAAGASFFLPTDDAFAQRRFGRGGFDRGSMGGGSPSMPENPTPSTPTPPATAPNPGGTPDAAAPKPVTRPDKPQNPGKPDEQKAVLTEAGTIEFSFRGAPWQVVMEQLAKASAMNLDWQELPGDYLDLTTQKSYTLREARDMINRQLMSRGYTMLLRDEVMSVVKLEKLDPAMVPRVRPEDLAKRDSYEIVRVSFPLDWLLAEEAVNELAPMKSPFGKLTALKSTNRLEAVDAVANLREIYHLLQEEQSTTGQEQLVRKYKIMHTRATDVASQLESLLGISKPKAEEAPTNFMDMQMRMMMMQQRMQQPMGGNQGQSDIHLVVNSRENCILAYAPQDKFAVIEQGIKILDVPTDKPPLYSSMGRWQSYRLSSMDPEVLVQFLQTQGGLEPDTLLQADKKNKMLIVNASLADHMTIKTLISKIDSSGREFYVIALRKYPADYLANSIAEFMGQKTQDDSSSRRRNWYDYGYGGGNSEEKENPAEKFHIAADVEFNRLMIRANEVEYEEVQHLLVSLGEMKPPGGNTSTVRVLEKVSPEDAPEFLDRLRRAWRSSGQQNELKLPEIQQPQPSVEPPAKEEKAPAPTAQQPKVDGPNARLDRSAAPQFRLVSDEAATESSSDDSAEMLSDEELEELERRFNESLEEKSEEAPAAAESKPAETPAESQPAETKPAEPAPTEAAPAEEDGLHRLQPTPEELELLKQRFEMLQREQQSQEEKRKPAEPSPIDISIGPDGRVILRSDDPAALDLLEELMDQMAPPQKDFTVFTLKYPSTWAYGIELILKDYFKDDDAEEKKNTRRSWWDYEYGSSNDKKAPSTLAKRKPMKIISDEDSRTIIVRNGDAEQLATVKTLIDLYDREPIKGDTAMKRETRFFQVRYSKASVVAETLKEVYRDLLSTRDKSLQQNDEKKDSKPAPSTSYTYVYGPEGGDEKGQPPTPIKFQGLISIGVDDVSNMIVVSSVAWLLSDVDKMVKTLDEAAKPSSTIQVVQLNRGMNSALLQKKLQDMLGGQVQPGQPGQPNQDPNAQNGDNNNNNNNRGGRGRGGRNRGGNGGDAVAVPADN